MKNGKKIFSIMLILCLVTSIGTAFAGGQKDSDDKTYTIGYSQFYGTNPFLIAMTAGAEKAIEEWGAEKGISVDMIVTNGGDTDASRQVADVEDLYAQGVDGLLIFPGGSSVILSEPVKNLYNSNDIPVVVTDIGLDSADWISYVITDNYLGGKMLAELAAKTLAPGAKVVTFDIAPGNNNVQLRQSGFEDTAKKLGLTVLPEKTGKLSLEDGKRLTEDTLVSVPDIGAIFNINATVAQGCVSALEEAGREDVSILSFDIDATALQMVKDKRILGLSIQDPWKMGYEGMNQMLSYLTGGDTIKQIDIPPLLCTVENASDFDNDPQVVQ